MGAPPLTHRKTAGEVHRVEVGDRQATRRVATAKGFIAMRPEVLAKSSVRNGDWVRAGEAEHEEH